MKKLIGFAIILSCVNSYSLSAQWQKVDFGINSSSSAVPVLKLHDRVISGSSKKLYSKLDNDTIWRLVEEGDYANKALWGRIKSHDKRLASSSYYVQSSYPLYISEDSGVTWLQKQLPENPVLRVIEFDNDTLLCLANPQGISTDMILSTSDWGETWKKYKSPPSQLYDHIAKIGNRVFVAREPASNIPWDTVYTGVIRTSDEGENWQVIKNGLNPYVTFLKVKDTVLYAGTRSGLFVSKNYGDDWFPVLGLPNSFAQSIDFEGDTIVTLINNQAYQSNDNGESWTSISDPIFVELNHTNARPSSITIRKGIVYIPTGRGIFSTANGGQNWNKEQFEGVNPGILSVVAIDSKLYAGTYNFGLHTSSDYGATWSRIDNNFGEEDAVTPSPSYITAGEKLIYANDYTTNNIYATPRNPINWQKIKTKFGGGYILDFTEYKGVLIARHQFGLFYSTDQGEKWTKHDSIQGDRQFIRYGDTLLVPTLRDGLWYTTNGYNWNRYKPHFVSIGSHMSYYNKKGKYEVARSSSTIEPSYSLLSRDGGITWDTLGFGVNDMYFYGNEIIAAFDGAGIAYSSDEGKSWTFINQGIEAFDITNTYPYNGYRFTILGDTIFIYGGTAIYKDALRNYITSVEEPKEVIHNYFYYYPPYPIPTGDNVHVKVHWGPDVELTENSIEIYTMLGEKVSMRQNISIAKQTQFNGIITWDCQNIQQGAYVMKVRHGAATSAIKIILAR